MTLPPFPSQDLAKLVLGYLAEEQLMTAYDEFLQASPYLDALKNEYDRIFMTSLRHILAEYRAVKIYVETCKPIALRRRLVQCTNLIEIVKFLATHVDLSRIQTDSDKTSSTQHSLVSLNKQNVCDECNLSNCTCQSRQDQGNSHSGSQVEANSNASLETTALEDLPGNKTRKKHVKVLEREVIASESYLNKSEPVKQVPDVLTSGHASSLQTSNSHNSLINSKESSVSELTGPIVKGSETSGCTEKIQEFNDILKKVCKNKSSVDNSIAKECSFQDFASGVSGTGNDNKNVPVPDSSTTETLVPQSAVVKDKVHLNADAKPFRNESGITQQRNNNLFTNYRIKHQPSDPKIKIISDIKVDSPYIMNNATSTPLMQTIVINGTPAYKPNHPIITKKNYTSDEIMAMPTIIVVTAADPSHNSTNTKPLQSQKMNLATNTVQAPKLLGPLIIDVTNPVDKNKRTAFAHNKPAETQKSVVEAGLITTLDVTKNASVPKDNTISCSVQSNTPEVPPPVRKSSSTPRRNSHIRVLDFTTPRRILQETINENIPEENAEKNIEKKTLELVVSRSPNVIFPIPERGNNIIDMSTIQVHKIHTCHINNTGTVNENESSFMNKKRNWDADLRLLATVGNKVEVPKKSKSKSRQPKKKTENADSKGSEPKKSRAKRKISPKAKRSKKRPKIEEDDEDPGNLVDGKVIVKPSFNIVPAQNKSTETENKKNTDNQTKNKSDDASETPETERLCLQNEIGAKLNISDFLETPYKQVLYDIQMETPKFLGSVLPDEPISDIKITSIPTPRFFDTPKAALNTPSSYSSRPTDYSSGGSYYKPDDQDYLRVPDIECPVTSSKPDPKNKNGEPTVQTLHEEKKTSRPVRKCAKNVSYYNNSTNIGDKTKEKIDNQIDMDSSGSVVSSNSSFENDHIVCETKASKENHNKQNPKSLVKRQSEYARKKKSPLKREKANTFMKIKPRRLTPTKENITKRVRRKSDLIKADSSKTSSKKKSNSKEKHIHLTPVVVSAPTKSRRKSSTPRKIHCSKNFSESSSHDSPDINTSISKTSIKHDQISIPSQDSDTEHMALRWSDDGSQDAKAKADIEDITKIQEYIITSANQKHEYKSGSATLQVDLINRGFDAETAKIIERDLLDTPSQNEPSHPISDEVNNKKSEEVLLSKIIEIDTSTSVLQIVQDEESEDELELSVNECNEDSENYIVFRDETNAVSNQPPTKLKDKFSMEVCIDDGVAIRLRATNFNILFDNEPLSEEELAYNFKETEIAVSSISNIDRLYTPLKDHKAQVYEIFDSTLTSLDTPLKVNSPRLKEYETTQIEIVIEEEKVELKDCKKRKRLQSSTSSEEATHDTKKTKPETQCIFDSANIQNMDIESVLKKLHGP